ncbi:MAG TPA: hypothetical protein VGC32_15835 [Solirubrobacterales bacterium]
MRRVTLAVFLGMLGAALWAPAPSFGQATYEGYVGCTSFGDATPSHVCRLGDEVGAFFESPEEEVEYEICLESPEEKECLDEQLAEPGILWVNSITAEVPGNYAVQWYVEGVEVASWSFTMEEPEPVTPPVTTPPVTTPPVTPTPTPAPTPAPVPPPPPAHKTPKPKPGPSTACLKDKRKIKALEGQFNKAKTSKQRSAIQKALKTARKAGAKAC